MNADRVQLSLAAANESSTALRATGVVAVRACS
jgi:hypothetical protein